MKTLRRSLAYSAADSYIALVLQLAGTVVIARILTPEEIGIFGIAAVFTALASAFRNFGIVEYLIQEKNLTHDTIRVALGVNIVVSWTIGGMLFVLAEPLAEFFRHPAVADVIHVQVLSFLAIPFGAIAMAWYRRELDMRPVFVAGVVANSVQFVVSVGLALNGYSYMSLAWAGLAGVLSTVAVAIAFRPAGFPRMPTLRGWRRVFHFGKHASGIYMFGQLGNGAPEMVIGRAEDPVSVALFGRANALVELFNRLVVNAVWPVVLPYFARAERENGDVKSAYLGGVGHLTVLSWPLLICMGLLTYSAIRIIYGPQWSESVLPAKVLCAAAAVGVTYHLTKDTLLAKGLVKQSNVLQIATVGLRVAGLLLVVPFGLIGACWGLLAATIASAVLSHLALRRHIGLRLAEVVSHCWPSLRMALLANLPVAVLAVWVPPSEGNYLSLAVAGGVLFLACYAGLMHRAQHPLWLEALRLLSAGWRRLRGLG